MMKDQHLLAGRLAEARQLIRQLREDRAWSRWERFLLCLAYWAPFGARVIPNRELTVPYMLRVYMLPREWSRSYYLHLILASDTDTECHNHPWVGSFSLILSRGYVEHVLEMPERIEGLGWIRPEIKLFPRRAGQVVQVGKDHFHRVILDRGICWSLFSPGRRVEGEDPWGFSDGWNFTPSKEYLQKARKTK